MWCKSLPFVALAMARLASAVDEDHAEDAEDDMGPAAFLWPPDRVWGAAVDNTAPCGSNSGVTNRTQFPLVNGQVAIVLQDESYYMSISVSYDENPTSNSEFETVISKTRLSEIDPGHECLTLPDPSSSIVAGANATLQIKYESEYNTNENETYYACADIYYVEVADFDVTVPCFNVSAYEYYGTTWTGYADTATATSSTAKSTSTAASDSSSSSSSSGSKALSGGAIAGITIGVVAAGAIVLGVFIFFMRKNHQKRQQADAAFAMRDVNAQGKNVDGSLHSRN